MEHGIIKQEPEESLFGIIHSVRNAVCIGGPSGLSCPPSTGSDAKGLSRSTVLSGGWSFANHVPRRSEAGDGQRPPAGDRPLSDLARLWTLRFRPARPGESEPAVHLRPAHLDAVVVSHAHNDHIGRLPCLVRAGYDGPIYATRATGDITSVMLRDSARIQREDAAQRPLRNPAREPLEPLFELADVEWVVEQFERLPIGARRDPARHHPDLPRRRPHPRARPWSRSTSARTAATAGSSSPATSAAGTWGSCPTPPSIKNIDILVSESTYGNRELDPYDKLIKQLHAIVARAIRLQSKVVIPAFSLGRTQRMVYCLQELFALHKVRPIPVYVDSPLAMRLTDIHRDYPEAYTPEARRLMDKDPKYFGSKYVEFCATWDDSRRLNFLPGPMVIIASSGMCEAGRIRHHLRHASRTRTTRS